MTSEIAPERPGVLPVRPGMLSTTPMQQRLAAFDWAKTPLGPRESWPHGLEIAVGICMSSRFPMFVWWGPERINLYNDAYVPILGDKHPAAFGRPAEESWAEIWDIVGAQARLVDAGEATWNERVLLVMNRHGRPEDTWFTWSYSPIRDEAGRVAGLFCACTEETPRVIVERERDALLVQVGNERARLAQAFSQSPSFLAILRGPDHVFEYVNERYVQLLGGRPLLGRTAREAVPEAASQGFFEILDRVYATGEPFVGTGVKIALDRPEEGGLVDAYLDFVYQPVRDGDGQVSGILAHGVDVTVRQRAEDRDRFLLELEDALRPLTEPQEITLRAAEMLAARLGADRVAYADMEPDEDTFNVSGDFTRGVPSMVGRYRLSQFGDGMRDDLRNGIPVVVHDVEADAGTLKQVDSYRVAQIRALLGVPLLKGGKLVAGLAVHQAKPRRWTRHDVELVEHVASRAYESIARARIERTLRESERSFRDLADSMPQIVWSATRDGDVDYFNRRWYEYTGLPESTTQFGAVLSPEDLARLHRSWARSVAEGTPYELEYPLLRADGAWRWHLARAVPVRDENGRIVRWFGTNTDIDERKRIEEALGRALKAEQGSRHDAELASRMKDEFLATLSHELRTPLNAILGWSHMIRRDDATARDYQRASEVIERNARAQARIIEDLLDMSAIISGKVRLEMGRVELPAIVRAAIDNARPAADAKHIRLRTEMDPMTGLELQGDANRLQQVLWNLLSNALKFTPRNGAITVGLRDAGTHAEITVRDTGQGISAEFLPHVFDRFRQADASTTRRHGGLGLGLAIVKQLVELHGGTVSVESAGEGRGATFTVCLPITVPQVDPTLGTAIAETAAADAARIDPRDCAALAGKRVLVVDDEADARELVAELLQHCRAHVLTAGSSDEALEIAAREPLDLLVSDIGMPGEDGFRLLERLRGLPPASNARLPAMALTAYARPEDQQRTREAGFQAHCAKPVEPSALIAMVAGLVRGSR
jgi:PAS domain S-box-containing protein